MIIILFAAGNFGSTVEYCLRTFSQELSKVGFALMDNGSMHGFQKECHIVTAEQLEQIDILQAKQIVTAVFPTLNYLSPEKTLEIYQQFFDCRHHVILIDNVSIDQAQRTQLFAAHKVQFFLDNVMKDKAKQWNPKYQTWQDMHKHELREALSLHVDQQVQHVDLGKNLPGAWYKITPDDLLHNLVETIPRLIHHCGLTENTGDLWEFYSLWLEKQQYIMEEYSTICRISAAVKTGIDFQWSPLSLYGEAILQSRLRQQGHLLDMPKTDALPTKLSALEDIILH